MLYKCGYRDIHPMCTINATGNVRFQKPNVILNYTKHSDHR